MVHRVKPGDNIYNIARRYGVSAREIISKNNLQNPETIFVKEVLIIPDRDKPYIYRVQKGDTLYKISQKLKIPMEILSASNFLGKGNDLYINQPIYIPYRYRYPKYYTIKTGDTLFKIASNFGIKLEEILILNDLKISTTINAGQILKIPVTDPPKSVYRGPQYTKLFPDTFFLKGKTYNNKVALTFDDGPDSIYTPQILNVLREYGVPATFFVMGNRAEKYPGIVKQITDEGHLIGNHTWSHVNLTKVSDTRFREETLSAEKIIEKITSLKTAYLRPPEGAVSEDVVSKLKNMNYKVIFWSVDSRDWLNRNVDQILINTLPNIRKDSIILFHSAGGKGHDLSATVKVLPEIIETLKMRGYTFVKLDELLGIPAYK